MLFRILLYTLVAFLGTRLVPGVRVRNDKTTLLIAIVFFVLSFALRPLVAFVVTLVSVPAIVLTLGLFALFLPALVNGALLILTSALLDDFELDGCFPAFLLGFLFALVGFLTGGRI